MDIEKIQDAISTLFNAALIPQDVEKLDFTQRSFISVQAVTDDPKVARTSKFYADVFGLMVELGNEIINEKLNGT